MKRTAQPRILEQPSQSRDNISLNPHIFCFGIRRSLKVCGLAARLCLATCIDRNIHCRHGCMCSFPRCSGCRFGGIRRGYFWRVYVLAVRCMSRLAKAVPPSPA